MRRLGRERGVISLKRNLVLAVIVIATVATGRSTATVATVAATRRTLVTVIVVAAVRRTLVTVIVVAAVRRTLVSVVTTVGRARAHTTAVRARTTVTTVVRGLVLIVAVIIVLGAGAATVTTVGAFTLGRSLGVVDRLRGGAGLGMATVSTVLRALVFLVAVRLGLGLGAGLGAATMAGTLATVAGALATVSGTGRGRSLTTTVSGVGRSGSSTTATVSGGGRGGRRTAATVSGTGRGRSLTTASSGEAGSVDAVALWDVLLVFTVHVTGGIVLADKHVVRVVSTADIGGSPPDTLRVVTGSFGKSSTVVIALIKPLGKNHLSHITPSVPRKIFTVAVVSGVLHVAADVVGPSLGGLSELVVPAERGDTIGGATVVVGLEARGLDVFSNRGAVAGVSHGAGTSALATLGHSLTGHLGEGTGASGEEGDSDRGGLHVDLFADIDILAWWL
jgi:hypothetical protein